MKKKEAGVLHVDLRVKNETGHALSVKVCDEDGACPFDGQMQNGQQGVSAQSGGHGPYGEIKYADGSVVYFRATNAFVGEPYITLEYPMEVWYLSERQSRDVTCNGHSFVVEREADTDYKEMTLIIKS